MVHDAMSRWVFRCAMALSAVVVVGSLAFQSVEITAGAGVGATLALANLWALRRLVGRILDTSAHGKGAAGAMLALKFLVFVGVLYLLMRYLPMDLFALLIGVSVVVAAAVLGALFGPQPLDDLPAADPKDADRGVAHG